MRTETRTIAEGWEKATLEDIVEIKNGATPSTRNSSYWDGPIPWCTPTDITDTAGKYLWTTDRKITLEGLTSCAASLLPAGTLLLCSRATIGEIRIAAFPVCTNQGFKSLVCKDGVCNEFLYYLIVTLKPQLIERATGSTFLEIGKRDVASIEVSLPPNDEQRAIAEALSNVDRLLEALDTLIAKKRSIKQAAMQQLLTGTRRLPGFSGKWERGKLADFGEFRSGSGFPLVFQGRQSGDYPFFKVSDLSNEGNEVSLRKANHWISEGVRNTLGATTIPAGSVVFAKIGAAIFLERKRLLWQESCLDNNMMAFSATVANRCERFFYFLFLRLELGRLVATTALPSLSALAIGGMSVCLPPPSEQYAIATVLADMDDEIAALKRRRDKARVIKQGMMQQLLTGRVRLVKPDAMAQGAVAS